jgi:DNA modification methylase
MRPPRAGRIRLEWDGRDAPVDPSPARLMLETQVFPRGERGDLASLENRLILGDNLGVMNALLPDYEGRVDLIYVDPPFLTSRRFAARYASGEDSRRPAEWETKPAFADVWDNAPSYLSMLAPRIHLLHRLLSPRGTLYMHLDWHASAYARLLLDDTFGPEHLINEIAWVYHGPSPIRTAFNRKHDTILAYAKSNDYYFDADGVRIAYDPATWKAFSSSPRAGFGRVPDLARGKVPEDWWFFPVVARLHRERTGYPTQKPESILERIVIASSRPGDLVLDAFCGSGTTPAVASRLGRRWLACDASPLAIATTYRRLLLQPACPPFSTWRSGSIPPPGKMQAHWIVRGRERGVRLESLQSPGDPLLDPHAALALWEIDWHPEGRTFRSLTQIARPWREAGIRTQAMMPSGGVLGASVNMRATDFDGRVYAGELMVSERKNVSV